MGIRGKFFRIKSVGKKKHLWSKLTVPNLWGIKNHCEDQVKPETPPKRMLICARFWIFLIARIHRPRAMAFKCLKDDPKLQGAK